MTNLLALGESARCNRSTSWVLLTFIGPPLGIWHKEEA